MAISFKGLLGSMAAPQNQYNSLLGIDPRAARWNALGGFLEGAGVGLMTGDWAKGLEASNAADERFQRQQLLGYEMKQKADNQAYDRSRDAKADEWREKQFLEDQKRYGMDYALRKRQADLAAENNRILRDRQTRQWGQEDAITQGQIGAIDQWTDNFKSQGGDLFSPEMQGVLRSNGIAGVDPQDTVKFRQAQPFIGAGAVGPAFDVLAAPNPEPKAPTVETFFENGQQVKKQWRNGQWEQVGGPKPPTDGIVIENADGSVTRIGGSGGGKMTEGDKRMRLLGKQALTQEPIVNATFDSMSDPRNLTGTSVPGGRLIMTPEGKQAVDAISNTIAAWLYALSGATATDEEVRKRTNEVLPSFGDDAGTLANKRARLRSYYDGLRDATSMFPDPQTAPQAGAGAAPKVREYNPKTGTLE